VRVGGKGGERRSETEGEWVGRGGRRAGGGREGEGERIGLASSSP
jgi:hypothetical protein